MNFKMSKWGGPISRAIYDKLKENLNPIHLDIINESYMHNVPKNSETHFKIVVVSDKFNDMPLIKRHRVVNSLLNYELANGVHALSIMAKTKPEWDKMEEPIGPSPNCRGGFGK